MSTEQKAALAGVITVDKEIMHGTPFKSSSFLIVHVPKNKLEFYEALTTPLIEAVNTARPSMVVHVPARE